MFLEVSGGDEDTAASVLSNFTTQRVVQPFVYQDGETAAQRFGLNCQSTLQAAKVACGKGCKGHTNLFRRELIAAGAKGPISKEEVSVIIIFFLLLLICHVTHACADVLG